MRADTGDSGYYDEDTDGEPLYGYVEYMPPSNGFNLKIGRQHIFSGIINDSIDDGEIVANIAGLDTSFGFSTRLMLHGISSWNIETKQWREHSYEAAFTLKSLLLEPVYQAYRFEDYFTQDNTGLQPFRFLQETEEKLVIIGAGVMEIRKPSAHASPAMANPKISQT